MPTTCEVFNLFARLIPQEGLNRLERGRRRQALVPDFRLTVNDPIEGPRRRLAELKIINCCSSRYCVGDQQKGVNKRASLLPTEYRKKAKDVDKNYVGTPDGQEGPVLRQLNQYGPLLGLVVGAWGEGSEDLHNLVQTISESRLAAIGLSRGRPGSEQELAVIIGQVRRRLSVAAVRANATCLLNRLNLVGEGSGQAAGGVGRR